MTFQTSANDLLTPTKYLVDANAYAGKFTTIASAIAAAVADGAAAASQKVILIKPGSYTEDLTLSDGIILKAWNDVKQEVSPLFYPYTAVTITGNHTLASGSAWAENIIFEHNATDNFSFSGGILYLKECGVYNTNADNFAFSGINDKTLVITDCTFHPGGTGVFASTDGSNNAIKIYSKGIQIRAGSTISSFTGAGSLWWVSDGDSIEHKFSFSVATAEFGAISSYFSANSSPVFATGATTTGGISIAYGLVNNAYPYNIGNAAFSVAFSYSSVTNWNACVFQNGQDYGKISTTSRTTNPEYIWSMSRTGYANTEARRAVDRVQTTDATQTTIWSRTLATGQGITLHATVSGMKSDYSAYCGGDVIGSARNAGAGAILVGTTSRVLEDSAGAPNFIVDVNGNDVRLRVTGIAAETWNWASVIHFQLIQDEN